MLDPDVLTREKLPQWHHFFWREKIFERDGRIFRTRPQQNHRHRNHP